MVVSIPHWDLTSDYLSQVRDSPVWISIPDFLFPPDILAMRTAEPKRNHAKLCGSFAALLFFFMEKDKSKNGNQSLFPIGPVYAVIFVYYESDRWPLDDGRLRAEYYYEAFALS